MEYRGDDLLWWTSRGSLGDDDCYVCDPFRRTQRFSIVLRQPPGTFIDGGRVSLRIGKRSCSTIPSVPLDCGRAPRPVHDTDVTGRPATTREKSLSCRAFSLCSGSWSSPLTRNRGWGSTPTRSHKGLDVIVAISPTHDEILILASLDKRLTLERPTTDELQEYSYFAFI